MNLSELSNEELDRIAITEVMGYKDGLEIGANYPTYWYPPDCTDPIHKSKVHPTTDRNQSRKVVEAAVKRMGEYEVHCPMTHFDLGYEWISATPRQEVEAAINAVRAQGGTVNG